MEFLSPGLAVMQSPLNLILKPPLFSCICCLLFTSAANIQVHFRLDFYIESNTIETDQEQSDLGPYCLQYRLPRNTDNNSCD